MSVVLAGPLLGSWFEATCVSGPHQGPSTLAHFLKAAPALTVKLSIRLKAEEVRRMDEAARSAGLSRAAYLAGLIAQVPIVVNGGRHAESVAALVRANAELADLCRDMRHLTSLLSRGEGQAAKAYRARFESLDAEVRAHLRLASRVLSDLQPQRSANPSVRA
ncbi:hypothetical protein ACWA7J_04485 [Leptothrix sp. BB-4]